MANRINATFDLLFTPPVFWYADLTLTIFGIYLILSIFISVATYRKIAKISPSMYKPLDK